MEYIRELQRSIMEEMGATVTAESDLSDPDPGSHPMGTTRMGADPDESVVNPRLRTHDVQNLYIASSSVFVTGGALNPTLTIAALSLKAADHIAADLE
jgi:choline dehydrogenase-like flavoprotein